MSIREKIRKLEALINDPAATEGEKAAARTLIKRLKSRRKTREPEARVEGRRMSKFTPGPWEYLCETGYAGDYPYSKAHRVKIGKETLTIGCHGYDWEGGKEIEANAHLIAAAPELYEALKEALPVLLGLVTDEGLKPEKKGYVCGGYSAYEAAKKALGKAEGVGK